MRVYLLMCYILHEIFINFKKLKRLYFIRNRYDFDPSNPVVGGDPVVELQYEILNIEYGSIILVYGITIHASGRMIERGVSKEMLITTIQKGDTFNEGARKIWDGGGRKKIVHDELVIISNYEENRIVTVYWNIPGWDMMTRESKNKVQAVYRNNWLVSNNICLNV